MKNSICHIKNYLVRQNKESLSSDTNLWEYFSQTKKKKGGRKTRRTKKSTSMEPEWRGEIKERSQNSVQDLWDTIK